VCARAGLTVTTSDVDPPGRREVRPAGVDVDDTEAVAGPPPPQEGDVCAPLAEPVSVAVAVDDDVPVVDREYDPVLVAEIVDVEATEEHVELDRRRRADPPELVKVQLSDVVVGVVGAETDVAPVFVIVSRWFTRHRKSPPRADSDPYAFRELGRRILYEMVP